MRTTKRRHTMRFSLTPRFSQVRAELTNKERFLAFPWSPGQRTTKNICNYFLICAARHTFCAPIQGEDEYLNPASRNPVSSIQHIKSMTSIHNPTHATSQETQ